MRYMLDYTGISSGAHHVFPSRWLVGCCAVGCCCFVFALAISIFTWNQSHRALGTQRQQLEQRTIASAPLGYRWNLGCLRFNWLGPGVFRHLLCVFKAVGFTNFSSNNMEFIMRSFRSKKLQQQHEGTMKNPLHLLAFSDTVWPRPCLERPLLRRLDGMAKFGLISSRLERRWSISEPPAVV